MTDIPYVVQNAIRHPEIPLALARLARRQPVRRAHQLGDRAVRGHVRRHGAAAHQPGLRGDDARPEPAALRERDALDRARRARASSSGSSTGSCRRGRRVGLAPAGGSATRSGSRCPSSGIFFSILPALDAQTRLLTGRYLEYRSPRRSEPMSDRDPADRPHPPRPLAAAPAAPARPRVPGWRRRHRRRAVWCPGPRRWWSPGWAGSSSSAIAVRRDRAAQRAARRRGGGRLPALARRRADAIALSPRSGHAGPAAR